MMDRSILYPHNFQNDTLQRKSDGKLDTLSQKEYDREKRDKKKSIPSPLICKQEYYRTNRRKRNGSFLVRFPIKRKTDGEILTARKKGKKQTLKKCKT